MKTKLVEEQLVISGAGENATLICFGDATKPIIAMWKIPLQDTPMFLCRVLDGNLVNFGWVSVDELSRETENSCLHISELGKQSQDEIVSKLGGSELFFHYLVNGNGLEFSDEALQGNDLHKAGTRPKNDHEAVTYPIVYRTTNLGPEWLCRLYKTNKWQFYAHDPGQIWNVSDN